ncbi:hypothetical protein TD95_001367 [Thielaviopsis punctulata]|uniref:Lytic polysaccharide monooxygenase n=1 Tax=Thielaviopsis punctulata TaxID=72032 RepID=A0A0F4ZHT8_9PEZI|nr:hypothetical protein TD95_001367 [Thielaviopsis punctulata]
MLGLAHMEMKSPPPFRSKFNSNSGNDIDYNMINPLSPDGSNFPCKGYESLLSTPEGAAVRTWGAGTTQTVTLSGGAIHGGGSCQFSLSYDKGATWRVIHSIIGNCPSATGESNYPVPIPADMPSSQEVLFAWTWYNKIGNREVYGNCAHVVIQGNTDMNAASSALAALPDIFRANMGNGCKVDEGVDVAFPNPGSSVVKNTQGQAPSGSCGPVSKASSSNSGINSNAAAGTDADSADTSATGTALGNDWPSWFTADGFALCPNIVGAVSLCVLASLLIMRV